MRKQFGTVLLCIGIVLMLSIFSNNKKFNDADNSISNPDILTNDSINIGIDSNKLNCNFTICNSKSNDIFTVATSKINGGIEMYGIISDMLCHINETDFNDIYIKFSDTNDNINSQLSKNDTALILEKIINTKFELCDDDIKTKDIIQIHMDLIDYDMDILFDDEFIGFSTSEYSGRYYFKTTNTLYNEISKILSSYQINK